MCRFHRMENRPCRAWKPRADGERLGLIGAAASMEAGHRRSMLEARPFAVRTAALAHGLCGYVQVAAAEGPACIVAAQPGGWLPFVVRQKLAGGWKALWLPTSRMKRRRRRRACSWMRTAPRCGESDLLRVRLVRPCTLCAF